MERLTVKLNEFLSKNNDKKSHPSIPVIIFGTIVSGLAVGITVVSLPFIFPFFRKVCLPYVPATTTQVENVLQALNGRTGKLIDLGSGDGRIVIAAAQRGFQSFGVELNPWLVAFSKVAALQNGVYKKTKFLKCNLWTFNLKPYQNIVIFGVETMMEELEKKFMDELEAGTCIVACRFPLHHLKPTKIIGQGIDTVWVYKIK